MASSLEIQDITGNYFFPNATCYRRDWCDSEISTNSVLDHCFSWKVMLSDDKTHYRLVSRPDGYEAVLTQELGKYLYTYRECVELSPEKYPIHWAKLQQYGWDVIAEHCDPPALRACNRLLNKSLLVQYKHHNNHSNDDYEIGIWEHALHLVSQSAGVLK